MNNLKRVLSLALSGIMLVGMMAVGAGAADFTDADKIEHEDAVNTLVALNIINGQDDGSFNPTGDVTRGQMAKMIAVALNGGVETNTGVKGTASFTDIKGHWAESYIEYCYDLGIINGRGDGTFDPDGKVTTIEATKMVLTALGYDAKAYELTGSKWATQTDQLARMASPALYEELPAGLVLNQNASRDVAAQIIWNGLQNLTVRIQPDEGRNDGTISWNYRPTTNSLLEERYNATVGYGYLTDVDYDKDTEVFTYSVDNGAHFGAAPLVASTTAGTSISINDRGISGSFDSKTDVSALFGQKVKVVFKNDRNTTVLGIFGTADQVLATTAIGKSLKDIDPDDSSVKVDGTTLRFGAKVPTGSNPVTYPVSNRADALPTYIFRADANTSYASATKLDALYATDKSNAIYTAKLIDNDNDGRVNCVVVTPIEVGKVTFVGKTSITAGNAAYKFEDCDIYEDAAKNDWAIITKAAYTGKDIDTIVEAELVNGVIDATRSVGVEAKIDDVWYEDIPTGKDGDNYVVNEEFNLYVVNGYVISAESLEEGTDYSNAVYVLKTDAPYKKTATASGTQQVKLLFADDTTKIVTVDEVNGEEPLDADGNGTEDSGDVFVQLDTVYTFSVDKNGNYELSSIKADDFDSKRATDKTTAQAVIKNGRLSATSFKTDNGDGTARTFRFNDEAVLFVKTTEDDKTTVKEVTAVRGERVSKWDTKTAGTAGDSYVYANEGNTDGFYNVEVGVLTLDARKLPGTTGDTVYGWVTAKPEVVKSGDDWYVKVYVWNGTEDTYFLTEETSSKIEVNSAKNKAAYQKGTPISYKDTSDSIVDHTDVKDYSGAINAVAGYNETATYKGVDVQTASATWTDSKLTGEITKDTVLIYVDMDGNKGVEGGSVVRAQKDSDGKYINNCYVEIDSNGDVVVIYVDVNNDIGTKYAVTQTATGTDSNDSVTVTATRQTDANAAAGDTVTYRLTSSGASKRVKVKYGSNQEQVVTVPDKTDTTKNYVDVNFVQLVGDNATVAVKMLVDYSSATLTGVTTAVENHTAAAPKIASGEYFEGDTVALTVDLSATAATATDVTVKMTKDGSAPSTGVKAVSSTDTDEVTKDGSHEWFKIANGNNADDVTVTFEVTATLGETTFQVAMA